MGQARRQRQAGDEVAVRRRPAGLVERAELDQACPGFLHGGGRRRIDPAQRARIGHAPDGAGEQQRGQVGFQDFGRIERWQAGGRGLLPQPVDGAGRWRPARPARWVADAWLARSVTSRVMPAPRS
jgi:hypothetical protein